jgi:L-threonylcarbamoyladenylate synthase
MIFMKVTELAMETVLRKALEVLKSGGIIAYPTETFYGLGVKFDLEGPLEKLYEIKKRPRVKAMSLIIGKSEQLPSVADSISIAAEALMGEFWPGPLTLLFPAKENISRLITAGTGKVAVRVPGESFALALARIAGFPITATSANPSGLPPADDAETVIRYFGSDVDLIVSAGPTPGGIPSTIVDTTGDTARIMREGIIKKEALLVLSKKVSFDFQ